MSKMFCIKDYIKIYSTDLAREMETMFVHFEQPTHELRYWTTRKNTPEAQELLRWLKGETFTIDYNELRIELSRPLFEFVKDIDQIVAPVFGPQGEPDRLLLYLDEQNIKVPRELHVIPGSARWHLEGRVIVVRFSTTVRLTTPILRPSQEKLEQGIRCNTTDKYTNLSLIRELIENHQGVEFLKTDRGNYLISRALNETVGTSRLRLMYDMDLYLCDSNLLKFARTFSPQMVPDDFYAAFNRRKLFPRRFHRRQGQVHCLSCYELDGFECGSLIYEYYHRCRYLEKAVAQAQKKLGDVKLNGADFDKNGRVSLPIRNAGGTLLLYILKNELENQQICLLEENLCILRTMLQIIIKFIRQELMECDSFESSPKEVLARYAYRKIIVDPILYAESDGVNFRQFVLSLI